jgi:hypothetical protein
LIVEDRILLSPAITSAKRWLNPSQSIPRNEIPTSLSDVSVARHTRRIAELSLSFVLVVLFVGAFAVIIPNIPPPYQDSPWAYSLNRAVAQRLIFGREIIFTLGPYWPARQILYQWW